MVGSKTPEGWLFSSSSCCTGSFESEELQQIEIKNIENSVALLGQTNFPSAIPVIDLVASNPYNPFKKEADKNRWIEGHLDFVSDHANRALITINNTNHYAFKDNPNIITFQVIKVYASLLEASRAKNILLKALDFSSTITNSKED